MKLGRAIDLLSTMDTCSFADDQETALRLLITVGELAQSIITLASLDID